MNDDWPELEDAKRRDEEERDRTWRELEGEIFAEEMEVEIEKKFQGETIREIIGDQVEKYIQLIDEWDNEVHKYLHQMAEAKWSGSNKTFTIEGMIIISQPTGKLSLYWEAYRQAYFYKGWFTVELVLNKNIAPREFKIECRDANLFGAPDIEDLKEMLVEAYELGPVVDLNREKKIGLPFEEVGNLRE